MLLLESIVSLSFNDYSESYYYFKAAPFTGVGNISMFSSWIRFMKQKLSFSFICVKCSLDFKFYSQKVSLLTLSPRHLARPIV